MLNSDNLSVDNYNYLNYELKTINLDDNNISEIVRGDNKVSAFHYDTQQFMDNKTKNNYFLKNLNKYNEIISKEFREKNKLNKNFEIKIIKKPIPNNINFIKVPIKRRVKVERIMRYLDEEIIEINEKENYVLLKKYDFN